MIYQVPKRVVKLYFLKAQSIKNTKTIVLTKFDKLKK